MGTVMEEKIKQAFEEWKQSDQQLKEESIMTSKKGSLSNQILTLIEARPGITGIQVRQKVREVLPNTAITAVPAVLKALFDRGEVRRVPVPRKADSHGKATFSYFKLSEDEKQKAVFRKKPKTKAKARGRVKVKEVVETPTNSKGITTLVVAPPAKRHAMHPLEVGSATVSISIATSDGAVYSLPLPEAKVIYSQLNQIFGAAR